MWGFICGILGCQVLVVILLCMPLPSNAIRGKIVHSFQNVWKGSYQMRTLSRVIMFIIFLLFVDAMRSSYVYTEKHEEGATMAHNDLMIQIQRFRSQRNAYITGFSLFLGGVIWRLLFLIAQLYEAREECKQNLKEKPVEAKKNE